MSLRYITPSGSEIILAGLTPGGDIEAGAVASRSGVIQCPGSSSQDYCQTIVTFSDPMPDNDYIIEIQPKQGSWEKQQWTCIGKTAAGFTFVVYNVNKTAPYVATEFYYNAIKTYTVQHAAQNAEDIETIKSKIPSNASSSNKMATANDLNSLNTSIDTRLDSIEDVIPPDAGILNQLVSHDTLDAGLNLKQNVLTFDSAPTQSSTNPVTSGGVYTAIKNVDDKVGSYHTTLSTIGLKNLLPSDNRTGTLLGITCTRQSDGSYIVTGATGSESAIYHTVCDGFHLRKGTYIFSSGANLTSDIELVLDNITSGVQERIATLVKPGEITFTINSDMWLFCYIWVNKNVTMPVGGLHIYPMIRCADGSDSTYVRYAFTNSQLQNLESQDITYTTNFGAGSTWALKFGHMISIKMFNITPSQTLATSNQYARLGTLPYRMRPTNGGNYFKYILLNQNILGQLVITDDGAVCVGFTKNIYTNTAVDLTTNDYLYLEETFITH